MKTSLWRRALALWPGALIVLLVFLAYVPAMNGGFVWDDDSWTTKIIGLLRDVAGLQLIWFQPTAMQQYYPVSGTTFWLDYHFWKFWAVPYHVENVLLHGLAALLFWRVLLRLKVGGAWLAGALFGLHPVMVESAAWITERKNVLSLVFYLGALLAYLRYAQGGTSDQPSPSFGGAGKCQETQTASILSRVTSHESLYYGLAFVLFLGALLAKTTTFSLPAVILLIVWWKRGRLRWRKDVLPTLPFFALAVGMCAVTAWLEKNHVGAQGSDFALSFGQRWLIAGRVFWFYLGKLLWPANLCFVYPRWETEVGEWWQWLYPVTALGTVLVLWLGRKRIGRGPVTALSYYVGTLFPLMGFMNAYFMRYSFVCDHWVYLPSLGPIALAAGGVMMVLRRCGERERFLRLSVGGVLLLTLGMLTWRQCGMYADVETLWRTTIARNPGCWMAYNNLGATLTLENQIDEAFRQYQEAIRLKPDYAAARYNLGVAFDKKGQIDEAIRQFQEVIYLKPDDAEAHNNLGIDLNAKGQIDEAISQFREAIRLNPDFAEAYNNLGTALGMKGQIDNAIHQYRQAIRLNPDYAEAHYNLGTALGMKGQTDETISQFQEAIRLAPDDAKTHYNLGSILSMKGQTDEAIRQFQEALRLDPDLTEARNNLTQALQIKNASTNR